MTGKLYLVGTPIGNLEDISARAVRILGEVDFIAAEDTRVTLKLLNHFQIKKPMVSYYEHNLRQRGQYILDRILAGETCAIVTDAGMPCISDPGEDLVRLCASHGVEINVIPGPSAAISALCLSGLSTSRFSFEGFLSTNKNSRKAHLDSLKEDVHTLIFYEAPHKLLRTLGDLYEALGDRPISLAKELTKIHEQVHRTSLKQAVEYYTEHPPKGEFVLIVSGFEKGEQAQEISLEDAVTMAKKLVEDGMSVSEAAKTIAKRTSFKKADIYKQIVS